MEKIKWGIIGPGNIANNFADGLKGSYSGQLVSIASKSEDRRKNFGDKYDIHPDFRFDSYEDIINSEHIDAIYISTPHTLHAQWTIKAAGKGKHILCEKPGAINFNEGKKIIDAVREAGVFYMEGFMYRCHPQIPKLVDIIKNKIIGDVISVETSFGFDMGKTIPDHRLFNKNLAGGGILDVGLYPISFSRLIAGVATGDKFSEPKFLDAEAKIGETGVDEIAHANLEFKNGIKAKVSTAIREKKKKNKNEKEEIVDVKGPEHLFFFEGELASQCIAKEKTEPPHPAMTWEDTLGNLKALDTWREKVNYKLPQDEI